MLSNEPTQFDLHLRFRDIPIAVRPSHWIMSIIMGYDPQDFRVTILWVGVVFVSILVHELGHALATRWFGAWSQIVLFHFGGYATIEGRLPSAGRMVFVVFAGPLAGLCLGAIAIFATLAAAFFGFGAQLLDLLPDRLMSTFLSQWVFVNIGWSILNLMPLYPLDGGQLLFYTLTWRRFRDPLRIARIVSVVTAVLLVATLYKWGFSVLTLVMFGAIGLANLQALVEGEDRYGSGGL